jgi:hypothetical protein
MAQFIKQVSTLTSGTITSNDTQQDIVIIHDAASLAITLTVALPATPIDGQRVTIVSRLGVTTLTLSSALTIIGSIATFAAAGFATYMYESSNNKWYKIS